MGSHITKPSNKTMVDRLVENSHYIKSPEVEGAFRAVDRAMYFKLNEGEATDPYDDDPWRHGNLHLSAPCIYAKVVEALDLRPGLSFLNLGSGTGYLNTIIGLLVGPNGLNHGIEYHADVVEYAYQRLDQFKNESYAIDKYDFCEPIFIEGNCIDLDPNSRYDRIYLGAACLPDSELFIKKLVKPSGGILVMPYEGHLVRYVRFSESDWRSEKLMEVNFTLMISQREQGTIITMPKPSAKSLKELCRISIRKQLRDKTNSLNPNLLHSDNIHSRRIRKAKAERELLLRERRELFKRKMRTSSNGNQNDGNILEGTRFSLSRRQKESRQRQRNKPSYTHENCYIEPCNTSSHNRNPIGSSISNNSGRYSMVGNGSSGVLTRSASRRLKVEEDSTSRIAGNLELQEDASPQETSSADEANESNMSNGYDDDEDDENNDLDDDNEEEEEDDDDDDNNDDSDDGDDDDDYDDDFRFRRSNNSGPRQQADCARARPYLGIRTRQGPVSPSLAIPALPWRESAESSSDESHIRLFEEHLSREVVLNWPAILRIHGNNHQDSHIVPDSDSSDFSDFNLSERADAASETSWDSIFDNFTNNLVSATESSRIQTPSLCSEDDRDLGDDNGVDDDDEENEYDLDDEDDDTLRESGELTTEPNQTVSLEPQPSTSRQTSHCCSINKNSFIKHSRSKQAAMDKQESNKLNADQEPVARRLRSKCLPREEPSAHDSAQASFSTNELNTTESKQDCSKPRCSRNESMQSAERRYDCSMHKCYRKRGQRRHCDVHGYQHCRHHHHHYRYQEASVRESSQSCSSRSVAASTDFRLTREQLYDRAAENLRERRRSLYPDNLLFSNGRGTTISIAEYSHCSPGFASRRIGLQPNLGFRTTYNNSLTKQFYRSLQSTDRKRKRGRTSSDSSDSSLSTTSSSPCKEAMCIGCVSRHRCGFSKKHQLKRTAKSSSNQKQAAVPHDLGLASTSRVITNTELLSSTKTIAQFATSEPSTSSSAPLTSAPVPPGSSELQLNTVAAKKKQSFSTTRLLNEEHTEKERIAAAEEAEESQTAPRSSVSGSVCINDSNTPLHPAHHSRGRANLFPSPPPPPLLIDASSCGEKGHQPTSARTCTNRSLGSANAGVETLMASSSDSHHARLHSGLLQQPQTDNQRLQQQRHLHHLQHHHRHCQALASSSFTKTNRRRAREADTRLPPPWDIDYGRKRRRERKRRRGGESECERYHNHISDYIRQLPVPRVLHSYLNLERDW